MQPSQRPTSVSVGRSASHEHCSLLRVAYDDDVPASVGYQHRSTMSELLVDCNLSTHSILTQSHSISLNQVPRLLLQSRAASKPEPICVLAESKWCGRISMSLVRADPPCIALLMATRIQRRAGSPTSCPNFRNRKEMPTALMCIAGRQRQPITLYESRFAPLLRDPRVLICPRGCPSWAQLTGLRKTGVILV
jgi:hypothetical protein